MNTKKAQEIAGAVIKHLTGCASQLSNQSGKHLEKVKGSKPETCSVCDESKDTVKLFSPLADPLGISEIFRELSSLVRNDHESDQLETVDGRIRALANQIIGALRALQNS